MKSLTINKNDLRHNINIIKKQVDKKLDDGKKYTLIGIVKGNGYGLGLTEYAKFLIDNGIKLLRSCNNRRSNRIKRSRDKGRHINAIINCNKRRC